MARSAESTTRDKILTAAAELLDERDLQSVTTRAISERAGVNNALVHYHFGSRTALLVEAATRRFTDQLAETGRLMREAPTAARGVGAAIAWIEGLNLTDPGVRLFAEFLVEAIREPKARAPVAAALSGIRADMKAALVDFGFGEQDAAENATLLSALLDGLLVHHIVDPGVEIAPVAALAERLWGTSNSSGAKRSRRKRPRSSLS